MARIFINYRRDDTQGVAGRLYDHLASKYARDDLFMDVDAMQPGLDFEKQLDSQVSQCHALLAVIGPHWLEARDQAGRRRLDNAKDSVRVELAAALKRDIAVIPVLVDGTVMPPEESLPDDLKPLARRHGIELRHTRFAADAEAIDRALGRVVPRRRMPWIAAGAGAVLAVAAIVAFAVWWPRHKATPPISVAPQVALAPASAPAPPSAPASASGSAQADIPVSGVLPPGVALGQMLVGIALPGSILRVTEISADPSVCQAACRAETRCVAWTYTQPSVPTPAAHCSLKAVIPGEVADACCTSGIEREPAPELREPPPVPAAVTGAQRGIELQGGTYRYFGDATPEACQAACRSEGQCLAWSYVRAGIYAPDARCFLKNRTTRPVASPCCLAGFERQVADANAAPPAAATAPAAPTPIPAPSPNPLFNSNMFGGDYRHSDLAADDWAQCQSLCKADNECVAWTLVHPGIQVPHARCWLKNKTTPLKPSGCCVSGVERAETK